jgi:hypothetical protein
MTPIDLACRRPAAFCIIYLVKYSEFSSNFPLQAMLIFFSKTWRLFHSRVIEYQMIDYNWYLVGYSSIEALGKNPN